MPQAPSSFLSRYAICFPPGSQRQRPPEMEYAFVRMGCNSKRTPSSILNTCNETEVSLTVRLNRPTPTYFPSGESSGTWTTPEKNLVAPEPSGWIFQRPLLFGLYEL